MEGYVIQVTYGTRRNSVYAEPNNLPDAKLLLQGALDRGYTDAKIVPRAEFYATPSPGEQGSSHSGRPYRRAS